MPPNPHIAEIAKQKAELDKRYKQLVGPSSVRESQRKLMAEKRRAERGIWVPACADRDRRSELEADDIAWLMYYFAEESGTEAPFTYQFVAQQVEMILAIRKAIVVGGDQALAASRGEGKTTLFERVLLKYTLAGVIKFSVLFSATGSAAEDSLDSIKGEVEKNERLLLDYPEVCVPVRELEGAANRAHGQLVSGYRHDTGAAYEGVSSKFSWCGQQIIFPNVPGSPAARGIIATRGLDCAIRGVKKKGRRVDVAGIDDPDTEETVRSPEQAKKLEDRIDRAIAALGSQKRRVSRVMLTTLQNRTCTSYKFTDPQCKPSWKGRRFRFLVKTPDRTDLWDEYVALKQDDWRNGTDYATEFYAARRAEMDAGAEVSNPNRHEATELSALQFYFNEVARIGSEAVAAEYDNDPAEEDGPIESGLTATRIQRRLSGYPRRMVPPNCILLSQGMDLKKSGAHWVVRAWQPDATNFTIDYGFHESHGTTYGSDEGVEHAVRAMILERWEQMKQEPYLTADGKPVEVGLTLVDSGWQAPAVYQACAEIGLGIYPAKGHGKSSGCATPNFHDILKRTPDRKPGDGWFMGRIIDRQWLVHCDTDRWKSFEHARWMTQEGKPGAAYLFGETTEEERKWMERRLPRDSKEHHSYAHHITAESEIEEVIRGALRRMWRTKSGRVQTHYLDASYLADVGAAMKGIRLLGETKKSTPLGERKSLAAMAKR